MANNLFPAPVNAGPAWGSNGDIKNVWQRWFNSLVTFINSLYTVLFQTNGVSNKVQNVLNLIAGSNVTLTADSAGGVTITAAGGAVGPPGPPGTTSPLTTKGDVWVYGTTDTRLPVGTNGQVLTANSAATDGLDWETPSGSSIGGVNIQTGSYTIVSGDSGKAVILNSASTATFTLPVTPPSATWTVCIGSENTGILTVTATANINGASGTSAFTICQNQFVWIWTDGTNYFAQMSLPVAGQTITSPNVSVANPTLTLTQVNGTSESTLICNSNTLEANAASIVANTTAVVGSGIIVNALGGIGITVSMTTGQYGGTGITIAGSGCTGIYATTTSLAIAASFQSTAGAYSFPASAIKCDFFQQFVPKPFASFPTGAYASAGDVGFASDVKSIADGAAAGSIAVTGGNGCMIQYKNGNWYIMG